MEEGIESLSDRAPFIERNQKVQELLTFLEEHRIVLIRSSPCTGKTGMRQLIERELRKQERKFGTLFMIQMDRSDSDSERCFENYCRSVFNCDWREFFKPEYTEDFTIIIDEAQIIYNKYGHKFWEGIKSWIASRKTGKLKILIFAAYGESIDNKPVTDQSTPFVLPFSLGSDFLYFSLNETEDLVDSFNRKNGLISVQFIKGLPTPLNTLTGGHIGIIRRIFDLIYDLWKVKQNKIVRSDDIWNVMFSIKMASYLRSFRASPQFDHLSDRCKNFLKNLLSISSEAYRINTLEEREVAHDLMKRYILRWKDLPDGQASTEEVCFISPIIGRLAFEAYYGSPRPSSSMSNTMTEFVLNCLSAIRSDFLKENLGTDSKGKLLERVWQMEIYRAATEVLPIDCYISPDVGKFFGLNCIADFYVNDEKQWIIEILREGNDLKEHMERFLSPNGRYFKIPHKDYAVINFTSTEPTTLTLEKYKSHLWVVVYDPISYEKATVHRWLDGNDTRYKIEFKKPPIDWGEKIKNLEKAVEKLMSERNKEKE